MNFQLDVKSYSNRFRFIPAYFKMGFCFLLVLLVYVSHIEVQLTIYIGSYIFLIGWVKVSSKFLLKWTLLPCLFLLISLPAIMVDVTKTAQASNDVMLSIFLLGDWHVFIAQTGFEFAYTVIVRSLSMFSCVLCLLATTPFNDIFSTLHKARVPFVLLDVMVSMYRFIFMFIEIAEELVMITKSKLGNGSLKRTVYSMGLVVVRLLIRTLEKYKRMAMVIDSRGFAGRLYFAKDEDFMKIPTRYVLGSIVIFLLLVGLEWWCRTS